MRDTPPQEFRQGCQGACRDDLVPLRVKEIRVLVHSTTNDVHMRKPRKPDDLFEKTDLFHVWFQQGHDQFGPADGQWYTRKTGARTDVEEPAPVGQVEGGEHGIE